MADNGEDPTPEQGVEEVVDDSVVPLSTKSASSVHRLHSEKSTGMESSILKFRNINFIVGSKDKKKNILTDVSGVVKFGRVLASKCEKERERESACGFVQSVEKRW